MKSPESMVRRSLPVLLLALWYVAGVAQDGNEVFPFDEVLLPASVSAAECSVKPDAVWVATEWLERGMFGRTISKSAAGCIRYFPSANAEGAETAVIFIHGDVMGFEDHPNQNRQTYEKSANRRDQRAQAERTATDIGLPVIRVGRPGTYGSTGMSHVRERRMPIEAHLINGAVDAIKARYGYQRIQLAGLSGGGGLVGAALTLGRIDLDCAVVGSGAVSIKSRARSLGTREALRGIDQTGQPLSEVYDPIDHIDGVQPDGKRRVFIVGDPRDLSVAFESQLEFQQRLVTAGIPATVLTAPAGDSRHHRLAPEAQRVAGWCKAGLSDAEIQTRLSNGSQQ